MILILIYEILSLQFGIINERVPDIAVEVIRFGPTIG